MAAGALVPEGMEVPPRSLVMGVPAKVRRDGHRGGARRACAGYAENYVGYKDDYRAERRTAVRVDASRRVRGHARHPARRDRGLARDRGGGARASSPATATARSARPIFEETELFARGIGAETDIVSKEMYTFADRDGGSLTLRPEATAGIVRAVIEHNLMQHRPRAQGLRDRADVPARAAAEGPLPPVPPGGRRGLRLHEPHDRRRGRSSWRSRFLDACGVARARAASSTPWATAACRPAYVETLREAPARRSRRRCAPTASGAPRRTRCACSTARCPRTRRRSTRCRGSPTTCAPECRDHFAEVRRQLELLGIPYRLEPPPGARPRLLRADDLRGDERRSSARRAASSAAAATTASCKELGGPDVPGIGFAVGLERLACSLPAAARPSAAATCS